MKGIFNKNEDQEKEDEKIEKEEVLMEQEKMIKFDKSTATKGTYKKLRILTNNSSNITNDDNPQSSTSLDSHSTSFSKDDLLCGSDKKKRPIKIFGLANNSNYCFLNSGWIISILISLKLI